MITGFAATVLLARAAEEAGHGAESSSGLPQFELSNWPGQIFWLLVAFGGLYVVLSRSLLPKLASVIEDRRDKIADDVDEANRLNRQADEAQRAYERALADARARAQSVLGETRETVNAEMGREIAAAEAALSQRLADAEARIDAAKATALANVKEIAVDAAGDIVTRLTGASVDADRVKQAVETAGRA